MYDLTAARLHGQINVIYPREVSPLNVHKQQEIIENSVFPVASPNDLILTLGPTMMVSTLAVLWMQRFEIIRFLAYDAKRAEYIEKFVKI